MSVVSSDEFIVTLLKLMVTLSPSDDFDSVVAADV